MAWVSLMVQVSATPLLLGTNFDVIAQFVSWAVNSLSQNLHKCKLELFRTLSSWI